MSSQPSIMLINARESVAIVSRTPLWKATIRVKISSGNWMLLVSMPKLPCRSRRNVPICCRVKRIQTTLDRDALWNSDCSGCGSFHRCVPLAAFRRAGSVCSYLPGCNRDKFLVWWNWTWHSLHRPLYDSAEDFPPFSTWMVSYRAL